MIDDTFHDDLDHDPVEDETIENRMPRNRMEFKYLDRINRRNNKTQRVKSNNDTNAKIQNSKGNLIKKASILLAALKLMEDHHQDKLSKEDYDNLVKKAKESGTGLNVGKAVQPGQTADSIKKALGQVAHQFYNNVGSV